MSEHRPVYDGNYATYCECGWGRGVSFGRYDDDADIRRHVDNENAAAKILEAANAERARLLTQGQNWDMP